MILDPLKDPLCCLTAMFAPLALNSYFLQTPWPPKVFSKVIVLTSIQHLIVFGH